MYDDQAQEVAGSGLYRCCRGCRKLRPLREFSHGDPGRCRVCDPPFARKVCVDCGESKPIDEFHANRAKRDGRRAECGPCRNAAKRQAWLDKRSSGPEPTNRIADLISRPWG